MATRSSAAGGQAGLAEIRWVPARLPMGFGGHVGNGRDGGKDGEWKPSEPTGWQGGFRVDHLGGLQCAEDAVAGRRARRPFEVRHCDGSERDCTTISGLWFFNCLLFEGIRSASQLPVHAGVAKWALFYFPGFGSYDIGLEVEVQHGPRSNQSPLSTYQVRIRTEPTQYEQHNATVLIIYTWQDYVTAVFFIQGHPTFTSHGLPR